MQKLHPKTCLTCGIKFQPSRSYKKYCTFECYSKHPDTVLRLNKWNKHQQDVGNQSISCLHCGKENTFKKSRKAKYCNRRCYRAYMDERFDRAIASNYQVDGFQNFDEFLLQEDLACPIKGCGWHGKNLGQHVNFTHGITAYDFKKMCGFNIGTGLVTSELSQHLANRPHLDGIFDGKRCDTVHALQKANKARGEYTSKESKIHMKEAGILRSAMLIKVHKDCFRCGVKFITSSNKQKNCPSCDNHLWRESKSEPNNCSHCGKQFDANYYQTLRIKKNLTVFCSLSCRQKANSSKRCGGVK